MSKNNLLVRMWRAVSGADDKEAFAAAHIANNKNGIARIMIEALGEASFNKLLPVPDPLNREMVWKPGTDPALWGDILLLASRGSPASEDTTKHLEAFHSAGGKFCNCPDKDGIRPIEYIFDDAYQAYTSFAFMGDRDPKAARLVTLVNIGIKFDQENLHSLRLITPKKQVTRMEPRRRGPDVRYTESVDDPEHAYYKHAKINPEVLDRLREGMIKVQSKSNVIPFAKSG